MKIRYRLAPALALALASSQLLGATWVVGATGGATPTYTIVGLPVTVIEAKAGDRFRIFSGPEHPLAAAVPVNSTNGVPNGGGGCSLDVDSECDFLISNNDGSVGDQFYDFFCTMHFSQGMAITFRVSFNEDLIMVTDFEKPLVPNPSG